MTHKELLELAATAAGIGGRYASLDEFPDWMVAHDGEGVYYTASQAWNPLTDDGDALRLAVKLGIGDYFGIEIQTNCTQTSSFQPWEHCEYEEHNDDPYAATRMAIVRAAAEIGKEMK